VASAAKVRVFDGMYARACEVQLLAVAQRHAPAITICYAAAEPCQKAG